MQSRLLSQRSWLSTVSDHEAGLPGTTSQACAGGPRGDQISGLNPWGGVGCGWEGGGGWGRALFVWSTLEEDHLTSHAQRGKGKNCSWKKMFFRFKLPKSFTQKTPLRVSKFTQVNALSNAGKKAGVGVWMDEDSKNTVSASSRSGQVGMPGLLGGPGGVYPHH